MNEKTENKSASAAFTDALLAQAPSSDQADKMELYGWLIGEWEMEAVIYLADGPIRGMGRICFNWVLEGRAIQDVWILPGVFYGSTLRIYDPAIDGWHILWSDPLKQFYTRQIGRACGKDIVQQGSNDAGELLRWSFTEITPDSFHWLGERSSDAGNTYQLQAEFFAKRNMST